MLNTVKFCGLIAFISLGVSLGINAVFTVDNKSAVATGECPCGICKDGKVCEKPCSCASTCCLKESKSCCAPELKEGCKKPDIYCWNKGKEMVKAVYDGLKPSSENGFGTCVSYSCCHCHER